MNQFHEPSYDAIVTAAVFAVRVRNGAEPTLSHEHDEPAGWPSTTPTREVIWPGYRTAIERIRDDLIDPERAAWFELTLEGDRDRASVGPRAARRRRGRLGAEAAHREAAQEGDVIDRTDAPEASSPAAARRAFRSKVDTIRPTYGFEDVSLAPGHRHDRAGRRRPAQVFCGIELAIPILASAMDAVVDARMAGELARLGGLAILNLEGVQTRYDDPDAILERIADGAGRRGPGPARRGLPAADPRGPHRRPASRPSTRRARKAAVAATPGAARRFGPFSAEHGADLFLVQSQVIVGAPPRDRATTRCRSPSSRATCRSRSRSATRPTPRPRSR